MKNSPERAPLTVRLPVQVMDALNSYVHGRRAKGEKVQFQDVVAEALELYLKNAKKR